MSYKSRLDALVAQTDDEEEKKSAGGNYIDRLDSLVESSSGSASQSSQNSQSYYDKTKDRYLQEDITTTPKVTAKAPSFSASADLDAAFESIQKSSAATQSMYNDLTGRRNAVDKLTGMLDAQSANLEILARNPSTFTDDTQLASYIDEYKKYETYTNLYNSAIEQYNDLLSDYNARIEQYQTDIDAYKKMAGNGMEYANTYSTQADQLDREADDLVNESTRLLQMLSYNSVAPDKIVQTREQAKYMQDQAQQKQKEAEALRQKAKNATELYYYNLPNADDFAEKSKAVSGRNDDIYAFINDIDGAREKSHNTGGAAHQFGEYGNMQQYSYISDDEIATYNYIYSKEGKEAADKYLNNLQERLNAREGEEIFGSLSGIEKGLYWIPQGLDQWATGTRQLFSEEAIPTSAIQYAGQDIQQNIKYTVGLSDEEKARNKEILTALSSGTLSAEESAQLEQELKTSGWGNVLSGAYQFGTVVTNMLPSIMVSYVTGGLLSSAVSAGAISAGTAARIASAAGSLTMGASAGGNAYQQKLKDGWTKEQAKTYATLVGASEALLQYLIGGVDQLAGGVGKAAARRAGGQALSEKILSKILTQVSRLDNAVAKFSLEFGSRLLVRGSSEALEEGLQEILEPIFAQYVHGDDVDIDWGNVGYAALMGFLAAGFFDVGDITRETRASNATNSFRTSEGYVGESGKDWFAGCNSEEEVKRRFRELHKQYNPEAHGVDADEEIIKEINNQHDMWEHYFEAERTASKYVEPETETTPVETEQAEDTDNMLTLPTAESEQIETAQAEQITPTEEVAPAEENALQLPGGEEITEGGNINAETERAAEPAVESGESIQSAAQPETDNAVGAAGPVYSGGRRGQLNDSQLGGTAAVRETPQRVTGKSAEHKNLVQSRQYKAAASPLESAKQIGIQNGSNNTLLKRYTPEMYADDPEVKTGVDKLYASGFKQVDVVLGKIEIETPDGLIVTVKDVTSKNAGKLVVRADHLTTSFSEIVDHILCHMLATKENVEQFRAAVTNNFSDWQGMYDEYRNRWSPVTNNYAGMSEDDADLYVWEEILGDAYSRKDQYGQTASKYYDAAHEVMADVVKAIEPQASAETTIPTSTETETPEARGPPEVSDTNTTVGRVEKFSLDPDTIDYAMQYTCRDENTKNQLDLLKNSLTAVASVQDAIYKEVGGRATQNIHTINDYLAAHPDAWQQLWNIQQNLIDAGVRCEFVTAPGTANEIDGVEVAGGLIGLPIEYVPSTTGKRVKFSAFWRQMPQMMLDSMTHDSRERLRTEIVKGVEDAYRRRVGETDLLPYFAEQFPTAAEVKKVAGPVSAKNISNRTMPKVQAPMRSAEKTVMALNLNSACPMFTIGNNGCYLDACYLTQMANGATGTNLFRSAWYTGEILQVSDSDIELMNKLGGLRINGVGDTTMDNKSQLMDVIRHAGMRGLKLKMITKQRATLEVLAELYRSGVDVSHVTVQPSMDTLWIPAELDDIYGAGVRGTTQLADTVRAGNLDAAASGYEEMFGRATKIEDGVLYRKYGFSPEQIREMKDDFPFVQITPRYVVCTAAEIAEIALNRNGDYVNGGKVIQTLMHGKVPEGCTSDYPGELLNFGGARHVVSRVDGQWKFYGEFIGKDGKVGKIVDGPNTPYGKVMAYVEANYTPQEQNKIWSTLRNQMCCQANDFKDACAGCQSLCARGCAAFSCEDFDYRKYTQKEKEAAMSGENDVRYAVDEDEEPSDAQSGNISKTTPRERTQAEITTKYQDDVDKVLAGTYGSKDALILGYTPKIYTDMGMPSIPFVIGPGHVYSAVKTVDEAKSDGRPTKGINYHGLGDVVVKNIYSALEDPIMIIASKDIDPNAKTLRSTHSVVAIIDVGTNNISRLLPVEITAERMVNSENMDVNVLSSAYDKDTIGLIKEAFAQENTGNVGVFYAKKEAMNLIRDGLQLPKPVQVAMTSDGIVHYFHEKVNMKIADATQSQQFTRWFGDWQNDPTHASKVVDEDGKPLVVYHGTEAQFDAFDASKTRSNMDIQGSFFSPWEIDAGGYGENVEAYYLNLRNPAPESVAYRALNRFKGQNDAGKKARDYLISLGYDGVNNNNEEYIAFYPEQIKSAENNIGTFDKNDQRYRYAIEPEDPEYQDFINSIESDAENLQSRDNSEERELNLKRAADEFAERQAERQAEREATGPIGLQLPTEKTDELLGKGVYDLYANREPEATEPTPIPEGYESMDAYESAVEARAAAAQAERIRTISKDEFSGTDALDKLGVKIDGSVGNYSSTDELIKADRVAKQLQREIHKAELRLGATDAEKNFAAGMAAGIYSARDIPSSMNADVVEELADYYFAGTNAAKERLYQQKHNIERGLDEKMEVLFKDSDNYKPSKALTLNYRTPERNMLHIFGDKQGEAINQAIFYPVAVNEAERFRFVNRMHDEVRKFENKNGKLRKLNKNERALVQMVIEGRAAAEMVAGMELQEQIQDAAANILNGADRNDAFKEFSLGAEEQKAAVQYARWLQTQQMLDSGKYDTVKIENAVKKYSQLFGEFYDAINDFLVAHGYEPIGFIKGYAPHMQPDGTQTLLNKVFNQLGINTDVTRLPTSIAGLTANFKPNKRWNPYFLQRTGAETEYDIATGFESYVDYMSDVLYHTDDTMRVRAAARYFRRTYAPEEIKNNLSYAQELRYGTAEQKASFLRSQGELGLGSALTPAEIGEAMDAYVEKLLDEGSKTTKYSDLVMWLDNYANILAGKQSMADRSAESMFGRTVLNVGNRLTRAFAQANVAGSLSSMLNQSAQLPMIQAELGDRWVAAAIKDIVTGRTRKGEWMSQSDFLVGKAGIDYLVSTPGEMALSIMFKPAELMDTFVATVAVRGKYLQEIHNGKSHKEAMKAADRFGTSVMGSRMKGSKPVAFNSKNPLYQMVNIFQIEAFNSWEHIKEDLPRDFRTIEETQGKGKAAWTLGSIILKGLLLSFLGNRLADKLYGGTPMPFDLIGLTANFIASGQGLTTNDYLMQLIDNACEKLGIDRVFDTEPEESDDFDWGAAVEDTGFNVMNDVPFLRNVSGLLGLGDQTLPMPDLYGGGKNIWQTFTAEDADGYDKARSILEFMSQFMPGGRQIKKSVLGAETVLRGGDFSGRGENRKLKYPIDGDTWTDIQAILFGKYATEASNEYYAAGNSPLSIKQTKLWQTMVDAGADPQDIYNAILDYRALSKDEEMDSYERGVEQRDLLRNLDVSDDLKLQMYRELTSADSRTDKFEKIMDAGLSFDRVMDIYDKYAEIDLNDDAKGQEKATEFAKWLDKQKLSDKQKSTIRDQLKYWSIIPAEASRYDKLTGAGLEPEDAYKLTETLSSLAPEEGADDVSNMQQYRAIAASNLGENEKISAIGTVMGTDMYTESGKPSQYAKMLALTNYGLSIDQYLDLHEADVVDGYIRCLNAGEYGIQPETYIYYVNSLPDFDADGNGNYTQAEMTAAVSAIPDIDNDQRAVLWQVSHKNWKANNNPWSYSVGLSVYEAINGETDDLLGLELPS